jgi:hypothetical protein
MAYTIEIRTFNDDHLHQLSNAFEMFTTIHVPFADNKMTDARTTFIEQCQQPFVRLCLQHILHYVEQHITFDINRISNEFYHQHVARLLHELIHGSDSFHRRYLIHQIREQCNQKKDLPDRLYRMMAKEKLLSIEQESKHNTDKKKISIILNCMQTILTADDDRMRQMQLIDVFNKTDMYVQRS